MSSYLPPVIVEFAGDARNFMGTLGTVKTALADLGSDETKVPIGGDLKPLTRSIAAAKTALGTLSKGGPEIPIYADVKPLARDLATVKTELVALAKQATELPVGLDQKRILSDIAALRAEIDKQEFEAKLGVAQDVPQIARSLAALQAQVKAAAVSVPVGMNTKGFQTTYATVLSQLLTLTKSAHNVKLGANAKAFWTEAAALQAAANKMQADVGLGANVDWTELTAKVAAMKAFVDAADLTATIHVAIKGAGAAAALTAGGGGVGLSGTLAALLGLGGKGIGFTGVLPAAGSLLALGGISVEHLVTTLASVVASAIGAVTGGAILAATSGAIIATGMGADLLVGASALSDISKMRTLLSTTPTESYAAAMKSLQLPVDAGTQAEWKMAQSVVALNSYWDTATSSARTAAVNLYQKFLSVANTYIPLVGTAATKNFQAIGKAIQPLINWLNSPTGGVAIFNTLEGAFLKNIPKSTTMFTNAVEGILKIFASLTPQTGGLLNSLSKFFAQLNTLAGQKQAHIHIESLISDFHTWVNFLKTIISTLYNVFSASKKPGQLGVGETIIQTLTGFLQEIDNFAKSVQGKAALGTLLEVHKNEALAILDMIPPIAKALGTVYGAIAPGLVRAITSLILGIVSAINTLAKLKIGKFELRRLGGRSGPDRPEADRPR